MFGQSKPVFGTSPSTGFGFGSSPFGQTSTSQTASGLFGQPTTSTQQTSMFGGSVFGATPAAIQGTTLKFNPPISTDTVQKNGQKIQVNTKHMCITAMKEYQEKSLEELRVEDYLQNRKSGSGGGAPGLFGTGPTSSFGFGAVITTTAPLFGSAPSTQTAPSSIFGSTGSTGTSIFGSPQPMNSFGQTPQTQTGFGFGQTIPNSIFASNPTFGAPSTTTSSFSLFGPQPVSTQPGGFAFGKSTGTSIFGTTTTTTPSLFGSPQPATQALSFGQPASSQSGSIFGGVKSAGTSIFGSAAPTTTASAFGSGFGTGFGTKAPAASVGLFGTTQTGPTGFGLGTTPTSTAQPGLGTSLFGAKKPSPFGTPASGAAQSFGFGATASTSGPTTNIFGGTTGFGLVSNSQPAQPVGGIFGGTNTAPAGGLFSKPTVTGFGLGQNNSSTSIFGTSSGAATGSAAGGIFGGGLGTTPTVGFGGVTGTNSTAFGATSAPNQTVLAPLVEQLTQNARAQQHVLDLVRSMPYGQSALFRHLTVESSSPSTAPTSASAPSTNSTAKTSGVSVLSGSAAANTIAEMHKANSLSVGSYPGRLGNALATRKPMQILPINRRQLFTGFHEDDALVLAQSPIPGDRKNGTTNDSASRFSAGPENRFFVRREAWKHLNIPRCVRTSIIERSSMMASNLERQVGENEDAVSRGECPQKPLRLSTGAGDATPGPTSATKVQFVDSTSSTPFPPRKPTINEKQETENKQISPISTLNPKSTSSNNTCEQSDAGNWTLPPDVSLNQTTLAASEVEPNADDDDSSPVRTVNKAGICLSKPGYYIFPTLDELDDLVDEDGRCVVQDFVIGRQSYGHILFPGLTDITGINFDEVVHIRRREVVVYPDDTTKPPQGYGLNRKAEITLDGVWPTDKSTLEFIKSPQRLASIRFDERLEKATQKLDASFIEYRPETGSWVFEVKHFSKYRLEDSDEEVDHVRAPDKSQSAHQKDRQLPATGIGGAVDSQGEITSEKEQQPRYFSSGQDFLWQAQTVSPRLLQPAQTFRGVRDSLFDASNRFREENEDEIDEEGTDFRRHIQFEMIDKSPPLVQFENATKVLSEVDEAQAYAKFETLQSVHNPFPSTGPTKISKLDKGSTCTLPYDRIGELINCTPKSSTGLYRYYFDSGLSKGDVARLSWSFLRLSGQPPQLTFLTANPNMDPPVTVVANSIPSISDEDEEVLLNSALLTSTRTTADTDSPACPKFSPDVGPHVLNSYLSCTDQWDHNAQPRKVALRRALLVCQALWADPHSCAPVVEDTYHEALGLHKYFVQKRQNDYRGEPMQTDCEENDVKRSPHPYTISGMKSLVRRQAVAEWIRVELRPYLESRLKHLGLAHLFKAKASPHSLWSLGDKVPKSSVFAGIFACLCCGEPAIACRLALTCRMSHLASCLSMAALCDPLCKRGLKKQLQIWNELKVLPFMPQDILRTYALLAGEIKVSITGAASKTVLNVLAGVPYLQALGIHLWYLVDHSCDLTAALKLFSRNWHAYSTFEVTPPRPLEDDELVMCQEETVPNESLSRGALSRSSPRDVCYHLLRLASRPWHSLERTLDPGSIRQRCGDLLAGTDWPSAWHLWRVLVSLGLSSLNPIATSRLHVEFASHLEACGLWEWAVFVLMHEAESRVRAAAVKQLLARHVTLQRPLRSPHGDWRLDQESVSRCSRAESFIIQKFGVSVKWFHEAKACLARSLNSAQSSSSNPDNYKLLSILEASHWLASGHVEFAHGVYMRHLLPNMLLCYNTDTVSSILAGTLCKSGRSASLATKLLTILQPFAAIPRENLPVSFDLGAGIYLMYGRILHLAHRLNLCKNGGIGAADEDCIEDTKAEASPSTVSEILADLQASAQQMVDLLQCMPTHSTQERVVKAEMATTVFRLISSSLHPHTTNGTCEQAAKESLTVDNSDMSLLLCQRLNLVASIGLPAEMKLAELETLSAESLASGVF